MVDLIVIALIAGALGAIAWATDKRHLSYGALLPAAVGVVAALITWIITVAVGLGYTPGLAWVPWIASLLVGGAAAFTLSAVLGRSRTALDIAERNAILRIR
ncbi:hypothetical protein [Arthrobacter sp. 35W]|uniref:hypothetical protein n=1 Tax=Arthrobacter sp. 35W TaxID=1132441 RepID=UPI00041AE577|nr:hypothetical protein [Arthrobacter sp. 35W]